MKDYFPALPSLASLPSMPSVPAVLSLPSLASLPSIPSAAGMVHMIGAALPQTHRQFNLDEWAFELPSANMPEWPAWEAAQDDAQWGATMLPEWPSMPAVPTFSLPHAWSDVQVRTLPTTTENLWKCLYISDDV